MVSFHFSPAQASTSNCGRRARPCVSPRTVTPAPPPYRYPLRHPTSVSPLSAPAYPPPPLPISASRPCGPFQRASVRALDASGAFHPTAVHSAPAQGDATGGRTRSRACVGQGGPGAAGRRKRLWHRAKGKLRSKGGARRRVGGGGREASVGHAPPTRPAFVLPRTPSRLSGHCRLGRGGHTRCGDGGGDGRGLFLWCARSFPSPPPTANPPIPMQPS